MALDRCTDDPRPFIEAASPTHPSVIDTEHVLTELYHIVNVPTMIWIDEDGRMLEKLSTYQLKKPDELGKKWHPEQQ